MEIQHIHQEPILELPVSTQPIAWVEISKKALIHNINQYHNTLAPHVRLGVVIKGNAYGHGMLAIASILEQLHQVHILLVVTISEAITLRRNGITKPILVLSFFDQSIEEAISLDVDLVAADELSAQQISQAAQRLGKTARVHVKVDTGLSRLGMPYTHAAQEILRIAQLPKLMIAGMFTHLADSECEDPSFALLQQQRFATVVEQVGNHGIMPEYLHTSCTAAIVPKALSSNKPTNLVRLGIGAYGLWPSPENKSVILEQVPHFTLRPILTWKTKIIQIKEVPAGSHIGYDRTYTATRPTKIAILPIGYFDGFDRGFSNCGKILINGYLAPVVGRVAMNMTIIDVTDIPNISHASEATILGAHQGVTAEELAARLGTINYEVTTRINSHLARFITE
jgi:alanine racemase